MRAANCVILPRRCQIVSGYNYHSNKYPCWAPEMENEGKITGNCAFVNTICLLKSPEGAAYSTDPFNPSYTRTKNGCRRKRNPWISS